MAKIIHQDLAIANATAWQYWNSWEPGSADFNTRYYLIALKNNALNTEGDFTVTKNLWALGHYSRFIRPGMVRINTSRSDGLSELQAAQDIMLTAFAGNEQIVVPVINYSNTQREISLDFGKLKNVKFIKQYVTSANADDNMKTSNLSALKKIVLQPRSISTIVISLKK